jgi:replication fork protection complex subunit TIPIN/Csm3/Swi3
VSLSKNDSTFLNLHMPNSLVTCKSLAKVNLKVWRDEAHGVTPSVEHQVSQDDDDVNSREHDSENEGVNHDQSVQGPVSPSASTRPPTPVTRPGSAASSAPSAPSSTTDIDDDMDVDALLREEEEIMREMNAAKNGASSSYKLSNVENDENVSWTEATVVPTAVPTAVPDMTMQPRLTGPTSRGEAEDEEFWNMIDEIENQPPAPDEYADMKQADNMTIGFAPASPSAIREQPTIGADWADMYE